MVQSMATRNKKEVTISDSDSQFNHEVNMGKSQCLHRRAIVVIAIILLVVFSGQQGKYQPHLNPHLRHKIFLCL